MNLKREDVQLDMYYQSTTEGDTQDRNVVITIACHGASGENYLTTQLNRKTIKATGKREYSIGMQQIASGSDPLLVAIEEYYRKNYAATTEGLITDALDFISGNLDQASTWVGVYGLKIGASGAIADVLPADVVAADGQPTTASTAAQTSGTATSGTSA